MRVKCLLFVGLGSLLVLPRCSVREPYREISLTELRDKIKGGWTGQMIGVSYGAPTEFRYLGKIIPESELPHWTPDRIGNAIRQDDLYVEMTFAQVLDDKGLDATTEDFGAMFKDARYRLWHANLAARRNLNRGVPAGESGSPQYNAHANDIDFQIEADFIGLMCPGLPVASNELCWRVGRVMNSGDGVYGGMFVSGMYAAAFFESDVRKVVESGVACLPPGSPYAKVIRDVLSWSAENPDNWERVWQLVEEKWNQRDPCPAGALVPFNIDAKLNGAYIALGLLHGEGDLWKTLEISTRSGQDSDCNPSNAAGIVGTVLGYQKIPDRLKKGIPAIAEEKFEFTNFTFNTIIESTEKRSIAMAQRYGGRLEGDRLLVPKQLPKAARLEVWDDYGTPVERIGTDDSRWNWEGKWVREVEDSRYGKLASRQSDQKGSAATISFQGTGAIVVGPYLPNGGMLDVYLDGSLHRTVDVYPDEDRAKGREAVWHAFGLEPAEHTLRLVVRGEPFEKSSGSVVEIIDLVVFE